MRVEIDQSGRIEYTRKPTVLAFSNSKQYSIMISASEKQYLQRIYHKAGKSRILMIKTSAVLIYLLIKHKLKSGDEVIIDREYEGYDRVIKEYLLQFAKKDNLIIEKSSIHFGNMRVQEKES